MSILANNDWCLDLGVPCCGYFKVGPSDKVRDRPRKFPHPGHGHEWRRLLFVLNRIFAGNRNLSEHHETNEIWDFRHCLSISFNHNPCGEDVQQNLKSRAGSPNLPRRISRECVVEDLLPWGGPLNLLMKFASFLKI